MTDYATSCTKLLQLIHAYPHSNMEIWFWWDVETLPYLIHGNIFWSGNRGQCEAYEWALQNGYNLDRGSVSRAGS